jgi:signal transduction histidine kinase
MPACLASHVLGAIGVHSSIEQNTAAEKAEILLVDDLPENLMALQAILEPLDQTLVSVASGEEALRQVLKRDFALILMDVQMPGMDGFEAAHILKQRERSRHIPILFVTAVSRDQEYVFRGYSAGAVDYIFKPIHPDILRSKVKVFIDLCLQRRQIERQAELLRVSEQQEIRAAQLEREIEIEKLHKAEMEVARDAAEQASRAKSRFLAHMSHELRTPLNAIIGYSELLIEDAEHQGLAPFQHDLHTIRNAGNHLLELISDILDLTKIEESHMPLHLTSFSIADLLSSSIDVIQQRTRRHAINISVKISKKVAKLPAILADELKVKQVLYNLLSNAAKFTPDGGRVTVSSVVRNGNREGQGWLVVKVSDTGIGIDPVNHERIFAPFEQVGEDSQARNEGTGLGLSLTKRLVELQGGKISVVSQPGQGSTFTFTLPIIFAAKPVAYAS